MKRDRFTMESTIHCPLCGAPFKGNKNLTSHLVHRHNFGRAAGFAFANLLYLDCVEWDKRAKEDEVQECAASWDITASQAAGRDVRRRRV